MLMNYIKKVENKKVPNANQNKQSCSFLFVFRAELWTAYLQLLLPYFFQIIYMYTSTKYFHFECITKIHFNLIDLFLLYP